jgi:PTS system N-acetylgalactosamine-specific IIA component
MTGSTRPVWKRRFARRSSRVVFTDLPAGSCTMAARRIARTEPDLAIVTGASVGMLLDFALGGGDSVEDLQRSAARARDAMMVLPPSGAPRGN